MGRLIFLIISMLLPVSVFAEDASRVIPNMRAVQAMNHRAQLCEQIRKNPNCVNRDQILNQVSGLLPAACHEQINRLQCRQFFEAYPQYSGQAMKCDAYQVCQLGLESNLAEGCKRYGIQVKDEFVAAIKAGSSCFSDWKCSLKMSAQAALTFVMPGLMLQKYSSTAATATLNSFKQSYNEIKFLPCLAPETQAQIQCDLMVKAGGALLTAGAGAEAGFAARMATLEKDLAVMEGKASQRLATVVARAKRPSVSEIGPLLAKTNRFRFFKKGKETLINEETFTPGKSYTVVIQNDRMIIGEDYVGVTGTTAKTHRPLSKDAGGNGFEFFGGAIRVNKDGSVDIGGYNSGQLNGDPNSEKEIKKMLKRALPNTTIRSVPGRLSDLDR